MHAKRVLTGCLFLLMIAYGLSITMIGPLMPILIRRYSLRLSGGGLVFSFHSIGGLLIIFVAGVLIDRLPKLKLIGLLFLLYSVWLLGIIIGRSVTSVLAARLDPRHLLFGGCLIGGILLVMGIMSELSIALIFAVGIAGLLTGATIPLIIALGCGWFPSHSGSVTSLLYLNSNLAKMIFPWLVGAIADAYDFKLGMLVAGITLVLASLLTLPLLRINQRRT